MRSQSRGQALDESKQSAIKFQFEMDSHGHLGMGACPHGWLVEVAPPHLLTSSPPHKYILPEYFFNSPVGVSGNAKGAGSGISKATPLQVIIGDGAA